jgi:FKBP-type peptidyl-prolyl cis-trans isomerase FkpA
MKHLVYLFSVVLLLASCNDGSNTKLSSSSKPIDSASYAIGVFEAYSTHQHIQGTGEYLKDLDYDYLVAGFKSMISVDNDSVMNAKRQWASEVINRYIEQKQREAIEKVKKEDAVFLEKNAENDSVTVLESGLQYKVLVEGAGISPEVTDTVNVKYIGTLTDGSTFDSSRDNVAKMPLSRMIPGWQEGLPLMKEGAKYKFYIPANLAYGDSGRLAGKALIFDVELVSVSKGPKADK